MSCVVFLFLDNHSSHKESFWMMVLLCCSLEMVRERMIFMGACIMLADDGPCGQQEEPQEEHRQG